MKKVIYPLILIMLIANSCKNEKPSEFTVIGDYTPFLTYFERLNGKVEKVIEKNYWAKLQGETYVKVSPVTENDQDSLIWSISDFEATFDKAGDLMICAYLDENNKTFGKWELTKENNIYVSAKSFYHGTLMLNRKLKCSQIGIITEIEQYSPVVDTLLTKRTIRVSTKEDTIDVQDYDYKGIPSGRWLKLFNDKKQYFSEVEIDKDGVLHLVQERKYNDDGKKSELTYFEKNKKLGAISFFNYENDQKGNWIKAIAKDDKGNIVMIERTYIYFE
jgi:hypothetical protein